MKVLVMLKNRLTHQIMVKEEKEKTSTCRKENKKVIDIMKGKTAGKIIVDFAATGLKHKVMKYKKMIIK